MKWKKGKKDCAFAGDGGSESGIKSFLGGRESVTESGYPGFRSTDGLYHQLNMRLSSETILSHTFYERKSEEFFLFLPGQAPASDDTQPNAAHKKLAELEQSESCWWL